MLSYMENERFVKFLNQMATEYNYLNPYDFVQGEEDVEIEEKKTRVEGRVGPQSERREGDDARDQGIFIRQHCCSTCRRRV